MNIIKTGILGVAALAIVGLGLSAPKIVETNEAGNYQIKQAAVSGEISVRNEAGMYGQNFGSIHTYQVSDMYYFSTDDLDGGDGAESQPINVRFNDGGTAKVSGFIKFKLSTTEENQLQVHNEFKSYNAVVSDLIRQHVASAMKQTASLYKAEETYSSRRSEFISLVEQQIVRGIFDTEPTVEEVEDVSGKKFIKRGVKVLLDSKGLPVVKKTSPFVRYGIETLDFNIKDIDFDSTIDALIAKKKEAQQKMVVAKAKAEEAKQDAITAREQGAAKIAEAKAEEDKAKLVAVIQAQRAKEIAEIQAQQRVAVEKLAKDTATVQAQKESEVANIAAEKELSVAKLERAAAQENAAARLELGQSEAKVAALKVEAGLSPREQAEFDRDTKIGVAAEIAKSNFPTTMITGGTNGGSMSPIEIIGVNQMMDLVERVGTKPKKTVKKKKK